MNVLKLFPPPSVTQEKPVEEKTRVPEKPWTVSLKNLSVDGYAIRVEDQTPIEPVTMTAEDFKLIGENISTTKNSKGKLSLGLLLNKKGTLSTTGTVSVDPVTADLKMDFKDIEIGPFQSYFTDKVKITLTGGVFSTTGDLSLGISDNKEFKTTYRGEASLSNFASFH